MCPTWSKMAAAQEYLISDGLNNVLVNILLLLITLSVQLCLQRDGCAGRSASADSCCNVVETVVDGSIQKLNEDDCSC